MYHTKVCLYLHTEVAVGWQMESLSIVRSHELELVLNRFGLSRVEGPVGILCIEGDFNIPGVVNRLSIPLSFVAIFSPIKT